MEEKMVDIHSMNNDCGRFAFFLKYVKENSKSIYAKSPIYGWIYRIEKKTRRVFRDGKQVAETCEYTCY